MPLICSLIVLWLCWKPTKSLERFRQQFNIHRFSFKNGIDQIGLGVFFSLMGAASFIIMAINPIIFEIAYLISLLEGIILLIAGFGLIINGILIVKKKRRKKRID